MYPSDIQDHHLRYSDCIEEVDTKGYQQFMKKLIKSFGRDSLTFFCAIVVKIY